LHMSRNVHGLLGPVQEPDQDPPIRAGGHKAELVGGMAAATAPLAALYRTLRECPLDQCYRPSPPCAAMYHRSRAMYCGAFALPLLSESTCSHLTTLIPGLACETANTEFLIDETLLEKKKPQHIVNKCLAVLARYLPSF